MMNRRDALKAFAALALCPLCAPRSFAADAPHWSYEGDTGPDKWASLSPDYKACGIGTQQSPIEVQYPIDAELSPLKFAWGKRAEKVVNNGHTIQVDMPDGSTLTVANRTYRLRQFHFHRPSEHLVDEKNFPMEVHFVHLDPASAYGVIGVLMTIGKKNPVFAKIVQTMPEKAAATVDADASINPNGLLPKGRDYFIYAGSLTTPPCDETVTWMLLANPIEVAESDIKAFAKLYPMNARPKQERFRRFILQSGG
jgi:carbonic anhydrase